MPITFTGVDDMVQAVAYIHAVGDLWKKTPGAIEWALKCRNVWQSVLMLREVKGVRSGVLTAKSLLSVRSDFAVCTRMCNRVVTIGR